MFIYFVCISQDSCIFMFAVLFAVPFHHVLLLVLNINFSFFLIFHLIEFYVRVYVV